MQITSNEHYEEKLNAFVEKLTSRIPEDENASATIAPYQGFDSMVLGPSAVVITLTTVSSGTDQYLVWVGKDRFAQFIRIM